MAAVNNNPFEHLDAIFCFPFFWCLGFRVSFWVQGLGLFVVLGFRVSFWGSFKVPLKKGPK